MITPGQQRIRTIVTDLCSTYERLENHSREQALLLLHLRERLGQDSVVTTDSITGHRLGFQQLASSYLSWIRQTATPTEGQGRSVVLDRFVYNYAEHQEKTPVYAYQGGVGHQKPWGECPDPQPVRRYHWLDPQPPELSNPLAPKWASTYWGLFELAKHGQISDVGGVAAVYIEPHGILCAGSGGNHRLLSHVLWGEPRIVAVRWECLTATVPLDEALHQTLLLIEQTVGRQHLRVVDGSSGEIAQFHAFVAESTDEERTLLKRWYEACLEQPWRWADRLHVEVTSVWLWEHLMLLRRLRQQPTVRERFSRFVDKLRDTLPAMTAFERWYRETEERPRDVLAMRE